MELKVRSDKRMQMIDITHQLAEHAEKIGDGIMTVFVPHTTAGITINENADPDVQTDILGKLKRLIPYDDGYLHAEGNSDAHVKASLMGSSVQVIIESGRMRLGTWQSVFFCEFDGPRTRSVWIK